jgi:hypothetical protein
MNKISVQIHYTSIHLKQWKELWGIEYNHLNIQTRFVFNSGFEVHYEYNAAGSKISRKEIASGSFVYESHSTGNPLALSFMSTGNGRLKVESSTVHEDYYIKDLWGNMPYHLGNTRITLRSAPAAQSFTYQQQNHYGVYIEQWSKCIWFDD